MAMTNTLNSQKKDQVNLVDLFFYLLRYWYIFLLCILVDTVIGNGKLLEPSPTGAARKSSSRTLRTLRRRPTSPVTAN